VQTLVGQHDDLWLLLSYDQGYQKNIQDYFDSHYQRLSAVTLSPNMILEEYKLRYDVPPSVGTPMSTTTQTAALK